MHLEKKVRVDSFDLTGTDFREVWSQDGRVPACSDIPPSDSMFVGTISFVLHLQLHSCRSSEHQTFAQGQACRLGLAWMEALLCRGP